MASSTQNLIGEAFIALLNKKCLDKITVKEIVDRCDINRNTFYYHFTDIYDLFDSLVKGYLERCALSINVNGSPDAVIKDLAEFTGKNKQAFKNAYNSSACELIHQRFNVFFDALFLSMAHNSAKKQSLTGVNCEFIAKFFRCAFNGMLKDWLDNDDAPSIDVLLYNLEKTVPAALDAMIRREYTLKRTH